MARPTEPPPLPTLPPPLPVALTPFGDSPPPLPAIDPLPLPKRIAQSEIVPPPLPERQRSRSEIELLFAGIEWVFGFVSLICGLAVLASLPIIQFLSLGYLLEAGGRVARSGRLRDGFIGIRVAARLGGIVLSTWLFLVPVRILADMTHSAQIIDPGGMWDAVLRVALYIAIGLTFIHIALACTRGGRLRYFLWPLNVVWFVRQLFRGGYYAAARDAVWDFACSLRLPHYFWLGVRGFVAGFAWLVLPVSLLALGHSRLPAAGLAGFVGACCLAAVLLYLPFAQLRMAATGRFAEAFNVIAVRRDFGRAPWAFAFSLVVTLLFALPLYLFKIEVVPAEAAWLPGLVFIAFIYPARLLTGWAMGRARRRERPRHWFFRVTGRLPLLPVAGFYVLIVFFTQYTSWNGVWSLYEQHAFLLPVPFLGL